jgi:hypothetical protein
VGPAAEYVVTLLTVNEVGSLLLLKVSGERL